MDREKFKAGMKSDIHFSFNKSQEITAEIAKTEPVETNILWLIEEMAELQQALIKLGRGFDNYNDVLQEIADVRIGLEILTHPDKNERIFVTSAMVDKAIDVKLDRDYRRIHENDVT